MCEIVTTVSRLTKLPLETVRSRQSGSIRLLVAWLGWNEGLLTLGAIAAALRLRSEGYVSRLIRRCEENFAKNRDLLRTLDEAVAVLRS